MRYIQLLILVAPLLLCGCATTSEKLDDVKRAEPKAQQKVLIQKPLDKPKVQVGKASYYSHYFQGRKTANGSIFDQQLYTAAHKDLPMPSVVKVVNLKNKKSVYVVVNDRGPYRKNRIIDLSRRAAKDLGMIHDGEIPVKIEYLPNETKQLLSRFPIYKANNSSYAFNHMINSYITQRNLNS